MQTDSDDFASDTREDMLDIESTLSEQSRESRDALSVELPGEMIIEDEPELDLPGIEDPELDLPGTGDTDLDLLNDNGLSLEEAGQQ